MAIAAATVWEVRGQTGNDTNGGGFVAGATGTDYSQQGAKNSGGTDSSTTDAVANGTTTITSATASFGTSIIGNIVYFSGGSGSITGVWRQVTARASTTSITIDASIAASIGMTMNIGGALASVTQLLTTMGAANKGFIKADGTYVQTATASSSLGSSNTATSPRSLLQGYSTTRGDAGRATIQLSTNTGLTGISLTGQYWDVVNIVVDCNGLGTSTGISASLIGNLYNCKASNFTKAGFNFAGSGFANQCEATAGTAAATAGITASNLVSINACYIHDNSCPGVSSGFGMTLTNNVIANNSGASSDGYVNTAAGVVDTIMGNTFYNNGRHGVFYNSNGGSFRVIMNNIFSNNGGYGINLNTAAGTRAFPSYDGNTFFSNTSGSRNDMDDTTVNKQNGVAPYTNVFDVICTTTPFVNAAGADWRLNQTATGGGLLRGYGVPQTWPGLSGNRSFTDMGAVQHQDPGSAS